VDALARRKEREMDDLRKLPRGNSRGFPATPTKAGRKGKTQVGPLLVNSRSVKELCPPGHHDDDDDYYHYYDDDYYSYFGRLLLLLTCNTTGREWHRLDLSNAESTGNVSVESPIQKVQYSTGEVWRACVGRRRRVMTAASRIVVSLALI
jgi:hypothetical protein